MKKVMQNLKKTSAILGSALFFSLPFTLLMGGGATATDIETSVTVKPSLSLNIPTNNIIMNLDPSTHNFETYDLTVSVGTNSFTGYKLYLNTNGTDLVNVADNTKTIPNLTASYSTANFPVNYWGYRISDGSSSSGDWGQFTSGSVISESSGPVNNITKTLGFASKIDYTKPSGQYELGLNFKAIPIVTQNYMQDLTIDDCPTDPTVVIDKRDEQAYLIQRLEDGRCWMLDNLNLDLTNRDTVDALSPTNTNADAASLKSLREGNRSAGDQYATAGLTYENWTESYSYSQPLINKSGSCSTSSSFPCTYNGHYTNNTVLSSLASNSTFGAGAGKIGIYYNYCAASAGSYCYGNDTAGAASSGDSTMDICPAGWRLPSAGNGGEYQGLYNAIYDKYPDTAQDGSSPYSFQSMLAASLAGNFWTYNVDNAGNVSNQGKVVSYWSGSIRHSSTGYSIYHPAVYPSSVTLAQHATPAYNGLIVRCILKDTRTLSDITYMQDISHDIVENTPDGATKTLKDKRDNIDYTVAKINGNIWMTNNLLFQGASLDPLTSNVIATRTLNGGTYSGYSLKDNASTSSANCYGYYDQTTPTNSSGNGYVKACMYYTSSDANNGNKPNAWYNYAAATAGTITTAANTPVTAEATEDICPNGWAMPNVVQIKTIGNNTNTYVSSFNGTVTGNYQNGSLLNTIHGSWWASTPTSGGHNRDMLFYNGNSGIMYGGRAERYQGLYIRCIAK